MHFFLPSCSGRIDYFIYSLQTSAKTCVTPVFMKCNARYFLFVCKSCVAQKTFVASLTVRYITSTHILTGSIDNTVASEVRELANFVV